MTNIFRTTLLLCAFCVPSNSAFAADDGTGQKIYDQACAACHTSGVAGAPKTGDLEAWAARVATGKDALYTSAIKGKGAMPAKGGQVAIADEEIKAAVDYMIAISTKL